MERERNIKNRKVRRRKNHLQKKIGLFCMAAFLLGVLCGKLVFAKEEPPEVVSGEQMSIRLTEPEKEKKVNINEGQAFREEDGKTEEEDWKLVLVNRTHSMEEGYVPELAEIENNHYFDARAVEYLQPVSYTHLTLPTIA